MGGTLRKNYVMHPMWISFTNLMVTDHSHSAQERVHFINAENGTDPGCLAELCTLEEESIVTQFEFRCS